MTAAPACDADVALLIGRFQPFHDAHRVLLREGVPVGLRKVAKSSCLSAFPDWPLRAVPRIDGAGARSQT